MLEMCEIVAESKWMLRLVAEMVGSFGNALKYQVV